ncbi:hypothetical protein AKO1_008816 [Acrasis kona]|uniref:Uncharacterized protein n=1 Tax=Acrasis kona TaxID=1008807 RepID=A0AAW2ZFT6_9EUKA
MPKVQQSEAVKSHNWRDRTSNPINRAKRNVKESSVSEKNIIAKQTRTRRNVNYKDLLTIAPGSRVKKGVKSNNNSEQRQKNYLSYQDKKLSKRQKKSKATVEDEEKAETNDSAEESS